MTFSELQDEVSTFRFRDSQRGSIKRWLNLRYAWVWAVAEWPFRQAPPTNFTVTAGSQSTAASSLPSDLLRPYAVFDNAGLPLRFYEPREFFRQNNAVATVTQSPSAYTFMDGVLYFAPTPSSAYTFQVAYQRKFGRLVSTVQTAGIMSADSDVPSFPEQFHYMLVLGASATGLKLENDSTFGAMEEEFGQELQLMKNELLPLAENVQFGNDFPEI